ncbi:MYND-type zinc finger protein samB [Parastagonospora nodorum]|nr:MYND-type zinc finger protein samB [Parastagonospora nodorum]KAH5140840.1 MYND-type zinc finger protein samB [Parastagonospora nodorum]KAH5659139.1 MYND-type zinc finger protein samB [Parastagonospora nodorum]KAH6111139.1 MYND-type zinc finger protein samB [Parastagonospora nodorum]
MPLKPVHIAQPPFFYAAGNTPAVCLTQNLPPEKDAALLLLGCGDIRNLLFTVYSGTGISKHSATWTYYSLLTSNTDSRKLDFTCCDLEAEIIARNVLALSLILDDTEGNHVLQLWNIYYHVFIDAESFDLLQTQAEKLLGFATSVETWESSPYGKLLRFCDRMTFDNVIKLWKLSAMKPSDQTKYKEVQDIVKAQWGAAKRIQERNTGQGGFKLDGLRAAAPLLREAIAEASNSYKAFWKSGICFENKKAIKRSPIANPTFACLRSGLTLHYGTNPLWGFHLSLEHARLSADSPLYHVSEKTSRLAVPNELRIVLAQFEAWCASLRSSTSKWTIRYVHCDALACCHVLQHRLSNSRPQASHWYRSGWEHMALELDSADYDEHGTGPTSFDVIDTSNLMDHLGSLNVLSAAAPLLVPGPSSIIRTEMLLPREKDVGASAKTLLSGDLPTMAILLGLKPVQYWANSTATWHVNESMLQSFSSDNNIIQALSRHVVLWRRADLKKVHYDAAELASVIYKAYLEMFSDESWARKFEILSITDDAQKIKQLHSYEVYSRAGLAVILGFIKRVNATDWHPFIDKLVGLILDDRTLNMGPHHFQSLFAHLEIFGLYPLDRHPGYEKHLVAGPFRKWLDMPTVVCVTLVVPHHAVAMFDDLLKGYGTPLCHLQLQSSVARAESIYPDIQLGFGTLTLSGTPYTADYTVAIQNDDKGYKGKSPLIVSAMVSTGSLIDQGDPACRVVFGLKSTPASLAMCGAKLGMMLHLHKSSVGQNDVFVTRYRPNMTGHASMQHAVVSSKVTENDVAVVVQPRLGTVTAKATALRIRCGIKSPIGQNALQNAAKVECKLLNPFTMVLKIGDTFHHKIDLPLPIDATQGRTRVARTSLWIEYEAPVTTPELLAPRPDSMFLVMRDAQSRPVLDHIHYVVPGCLPKLYVGNSNSHAQWMTMCTSIAATMSVTEVAMQEKASSCDITNKPGRLGVKESIYMMIMHIFGLFDKERSYMFSLHGASGEIALVFVDAVRMDVSNQTVFLDAAIIQLHAKTGPEIARSTSSLYGQTVIVLTADKNEVPFWLHLLPTFAERCRTWEHKGSCEYEVKGAHIPLSTQLNEQIMCSCGMGIFPNGYLKHLKPFQALKKHAVRAAIPVIYSSPISPDTGALPPSFTKTFKPKPTAPPSTSTPAATKPRVENLDAKRASCFQCMAKEGKEGAPLLSCSGCRFARYCSKACQVKNWKEEHRHLCRQLKSASGR